MNILALILSATNTNAVSSAKEAASSVSFLKGGLAGLGTVAVYFIFGLVALAIGRIVWNLITPYNSNVEIGENDNYSAGIAEFGFLIAIAIIILGTLSGSSPLPLWQDLVISTIYFFIGLVALAVGKWVLNLITPFDINKEISRDRNNAAGWLQAGFYIALAIIIYGVIK